MTWPSGYALKHFDVVDSTNEEAKRLALSGEAGPIWIVAEKQTAGRGRRGRTWESPVGNLAATLLLRPDAPASKSAQLSFVAALAASDAVAAFAPGAETRVKWPNDVLLQDRKVAGILLESASSGAPVPDWLAVGIGINLVASPRDTEFPATSLAEFGHTPPTVATAAAHLARAWNRWYDIWRAHGFGQIRDVWISRAARLGTRIRARLASEELHGIFEGIDQEGALILRQSVGETRTISAGEVFFQGP